jgi:hypothetical protein
MMMGDLIDPIDHGKTSTKGLLSSYLIHMLLLRPVLFLSNMIMKDLQNSVPFTFIVRLQNMHQYHRLLRRRAVTTHTEDERIQLLELLQTAAGVGRIEIVGVHPKGGYSVTFDVSADSIDTFASILEAGDWMSVI